jgi:peroxiredoxin
MRRPLRGLHALRSLLVLVVAGLALAGCAAGNDATVYGGSFTFTSPGGKSEFSYPADQRKNLDELSGPDLSGKKTVSLSDYTGKIVVINFWGSWCPPCRDEAGQLQAASVALAPMGVQFLGIDVKDEPGAGAAFNASKQITYPSIFDPGQRTLLSIRGFPTGSIPSTIVLDKQHRVAHIWLQEINSGDLKNVITPLAAES